MAIPELALEGKKALLIGAGRGIGKGIALVLAEAGADIAVSGLTSTGAEAVAEAVRGMGRQAIALSGDATKAADMERLTREALDRFGSFDILVNCTGDSVSKPVAKLPDSEQAGMTEEEWHSILDVNLTQAFVCCSTVGPHFLERRSGVVINISGIAAFRGAANRSTYDAAKAGLMRFTESLALEWAPYGIRVNSIAPGHFPDPDQMSGDEYGRRNETAKGRIPLGRVGILREVGLLAVYLASDASAYVTGQTWAIDGGLSLV